MIWYRPRRSRARVVRRLSVCLILAPVGVQADGWDCAPVPGDGGWRCSGHVPATHARPAVVQPAVMPANYSPSEVARGRPVLLPAAATGSADSPPSPERAVDSAPTPPQSEPVAPENGETEPLTAVPAESGEGVAPATRFIDPPAELAEVDDRPLYDGLTWGFCGPRPPRLGAPPADPPETGDETIYIDADDAQYDRDREHFTLLGNIDLRYGSRRVNADRMTYDRNSSDVIAIGNVFLEDPGLRIVGQQAQFNLRTDQGRIWNSGYRLSGKINARGRADQVDIVDSKLTRYRGIEYSACRPGQPDWSIKAARLKLDQHKGRGVARHARLRVRGVPLLYTPYISFPIDDRRKSGFLIPSFGNSEDNGIELTIPYYWNIAPNLDATFYPRFMSRRGTLLGGELRFLTERQEGEFYGEVLPQDNLAEEGTTRWALRLEHKARITPRILSIIDFSEVSDTGYLGDFGNSLEVTSQRNIARRGFIGYFLPKFRIYATLQDFQTIDPSILPLFEPYARLPQVKTELGPWDFGPGLRFEAEGEYDYFAHVERVEGHRGSLRPILSLPIRRSFGHLIPRADLHLTTYSLEEVEDRNSNPGYAIPSLSLDGQLIFERDIGWFGSPVLQTIEPRLFYLYTPFVDQSDAPTFDSTERTFSYASMFDVNRFTGPDRVGDANQLTVGLSSRTLSKATGLELFRASVAQILYFDDRDVQLIGLPETETTSAIVGELSARFTPHWSGRVGLQYDPNAEEFQSEKRVLSLHYETPDDTLLNVNYRFDVGRTLAQRYEDTDVSFRLPVGEQLTFVGRWFYSLLQSETVEAFGGIEYGRCCWRFRVIGRHLKNEPNTAGTTSVMMQLELAGLGSIGQTVDRFLEEGIYGYHVE